MGKSRNLVTPAEGRGVLKNGGIYYPNLVTGEDTEGEQNLMERKVMKRKMLKKNMAERSLEKGNPVEKNLTEYGLLRLNYLKEQAGVMYEELLFRGELKEHLLEVQEQAEKMFQSLLERYLERMGILFFGSFFSLSF